MSRRRAPFPPASLACLPACLPILALSLAQAMMFPSLLAPPAVYPSLLRPTPALTLPQTLQSAFSGPSGFLVDDLLRIGRPAGYPPRGSAPPPSLSPPVAGVGAARTEAASSAELVSVDSSGAKTSCSARSSLTSSGDATFLKFGVNAILSSPPRTGKWPARQQRPPSEPSA